MKYRIKHKTVYHYSQSVSMCFNEARMTPLSNSHQTCAKNRFVIQPVPETVNRRVDYFGNQVMHFDILQSHQELSVLVISEVEVFDHANLLLEANDVPWEVVRDTVRTSTVPEHIALREYTLASPLIPLIQEVQDYARTIFLPGRPMLEAVQTLMARIHKEFTYDPDATSISTPIKEVMQTKRGVCQDFAHLAIACLRSVGLPALYVSGYLETLPPPGQPKLEGADASHAWFAVHMLDGGWVHFDPTNNITPSLQHIIVAHGRDFADVTPLKGVIYGGNEHTLRVSVDVQRIDGASPATD